MDFSKNEMILIGKDGSQKARSDELDLPQFFTKIDKMPLRRAEMQRNRD